MRAYTRLLPSDAQEYIESIAKIQRWDARFVTVEAVQDFGQQRATALHTSSLNRLLSAQVAHSRGQKRP
jgi:hypothetical protein